MSTNPFQEHDFSYFEGLVKNGLKTVIVDIDGTLVDSDIIRPYFYLKRSKSRYRFSHYWWLVWVHIFYGPYYKLLDAIDRSLFQRAFYKRYYAFTHEEVVSSGKAFFNDVLRHRFIPYTHDLLFFLKERDVKVVLLSTALESVVKPLADYFGLPYHCPGIGSDNERCGINTSGLCDFKYYFIIKSDPKGLMVIADSRHDLPILTYAEFPVVVAKKRMRWMKQTGGKIVISNSLEDI